MKAFALAALLALAACAPNIPSSRWLGAPMFVVTNFDVARLSGRWYEVASFPAPFQRDCVATVVEYTPRPDGLIGVRNQCRVAGQPNTVRQIEGTARVTAPGRLQVRLQGVPFQGQLWVLDVSRDGRTLVLGTPSRNGGWVLRREPTVSPEQFRAARDVFERNGYDAAALQRTRQK